jgi:hypothetical protein
MGKNLVYAATSGSPDRLLGLGELAAAGAFSAVPMAFVAAPVERVKVLLQVSFRQYIVSSDAMLRLVCTDRRREAQAAI